MAPLPDNSTARLYLDYTSTGISHTMEVRLGAGADVVGAAVVASDLAGLFSIHMTDNDSFTGARFSAQGQNFSLPITFTPVQGQISFNNGAPWWTEDPQSAFISLVGRGNLTARKVRWIFFTPVKSVAWPADNRYAPGESAPIDSLRLNFTTIVQSGGSTGEQIVTIGGDIPTVYGYVNIAKHGYWQRKQR